MNCSTTLPWLGIVTTGFFHLEGGKKKIIASRVQLTPIAKHLHVWHIVIYNLLLCAFQLPASVFLVIYKQCPFNGNNVANSINRVLSSWSGEWYGNELLYSATFVGVGYNRILLAFSSLLCGQMHLNVSTASWLFRNKPEIGSTNASRAPVTCCFGSYQQAIVYTGLLWLTFK